MPNKKFKSFIRNRPQQGHSLYTSKKQWNVIQRDHGKTVRANPSYTTGDDTSPIDMRWLQLVSEYQKKAQLLVPSTANIVRSSHNRYLFISFYLLLINASIASGNTPANTPDKASQENSVTSCDVTDLENTQSVNLNIVSTTSNGMILGEEKATIFSSTSHNNKKASSLHEAIILDTIYELFHRKEQEITIKKEVNSLLKVGANINGLSDVFHNRSALMLASMYGLTEIVDILLDAGADVHKADDDGSSLIRLAARSGKKELIEKLYRAGAPLDRNDSFLYIVSLEHRDGALTKWFIKQGVSLNRYKIGNKIHNPLEKAIRMGYPDIVQLMLEKKGDLTPAELEIDPSKIDPIKSAIRWNNPGFLSDFIKERASRENILIGKDYSMVAYAMKIDREDIALYFLQKHQSAYTEPNSSDLVYLAAKYGHSDILLRLLINGVNINPEALQSEDDSAYKQYSPLQIALEKNHPDTALLLIARGAKIKEGHLSLNDLLGMALEYKDEYAAAALIRKGADISQHYQIRFRSSEGEYPLLHVATLLEYYPVIEALQSRGVDLDQKMPYRSKDGNIENITPLGIALREGLEFVACFLLHHGASTNQNFIKMDILTEVKNREYSDLQRCMTIRGFKFPQGFFSSFRESIEKSIDHVTKTFR